MRRYWVAGAAFVVVIATGAVRADDLPPIMAFKAPVPVAAPASWTGFYIGGHLGGALEYSSLQDPFGPVSYGDHVTTTAAIAGGQIGANYQIGNVVVGGAADLSWVTSRGDETCFGIVGGAFYTSNCSVDPTLLSTFDARLGYALGRALYYVKGGAAWEHTDVDMTINLNPGHHFLASANSYGAWGWTAGGGVEYALTPAWSLLLEYDFLDFGSSSVATPYVPGNPLPHHPVGPIAGLSSDIEEVKLGLNYRLGADPTPWPANASMPLVMSVLPLRAPTPAASGWEIEGGARYMYSSGRAQWEYAFSRSFPNWFDFSKLTWNNLQTNSAELFGRVDTPWNVFLSGFVGAGATFAGGQNDEDFDYPNRAYNNTFSTNKGDINYAVADVGYDLLRSTDFKVGPFVGYTVFGQDIFKGGCQQIASPLGNCVIPAPSSQLIGLENMTWQALRVGLSGQLSLTDRLRLTTDAAYLPYVTYGWLDDHVLRNLQWYNWGEGVGVQTQTVLSYDLTDRLSLGIGARYWAMWSTTGDRRTIPGNGVPFPTRNTVDLLGAFTQVSYRFDPDHAGAAKPGALPSPFKVPADPPAYSWTGAYGGIEGGMVFGDSYQIGQTVHRHTFDSTPSFDVDGDLLGATLGYNSQFSGIWVFGLESDMSWVDASGSAHQIPPFNVSQTASTQEDWLATARARIGVTPVNGWLVYGTGGIAAADVGAKVVNANGTTAFPEQSYVRPGWTAGGGVETAIIGNWSAKLEYLDVGLENHAYFVPTPNNPHVTNRAGGVPLDDNIVRAGINYRFGWL